MNTRFSYFYRDKGNFKNGGDVVLRGEFTAAQFDRLTKSMSNGNAFIAHQVRVIEVFLWTQDADYDIDNPPERIGPSCYGKSGPYRINDTDHCWHTFGRVEVTADAVTDRLNRTVEEFVLEFENAANGGWWEFDPESRRRQVTVLCPKPSSHADN